MQSIQIEDGFKESFKEDLTRKARKKIQPVLEKFAKSLKKVKNPLILNPDFLVREEEPIGIKLKPGDRLYSVQLIPGYLLYFYSFGSESPVYKLIRFASMPKSGKFLY